MCRTLGFRSSIGWKWETQQAEIIHMAKNIQCDLIVIGTHGRTGLAHLLMGSVAEHVVRKATCPVLVVKTPIPENPSA